MNKGDKQLSCLMFIFKGRHDAGRVIAHRTRAANVFTFMMERYNCVKFKNNSYYKGSFVIGQLHKLQTSGGMNEFQNNNFFFFFYLLNFTHYNE